MRGSCAQVLLAGDAAALCCNSFVKGPLVAVPVWDVNWSLVLTAAVTTAAALLAQPALPKGKPAAVISMPCPGRVYC